MSARVELDLCDSEPRSLLMIGTSFRGSVNSLHGPRLKHSDPNVFGKVRKTRKEVRAFLDWVRELPEISEALVWSTCQRIEFYGWLTGANDSAALESAVKRIRGRLYGHPEPNGLEVNTLFGMEAWHHLMRAACGLCSALPGDKDVVAQLQTAGRTAKRAGTVGPRATCLVNTAVELSRAVRAETTWGHFSPGFCFAALSRVQQVDGAQMDGCRHVVVGGSATSRSILAALSQHFQVPQTLMSLLYRKHHGQLKLLRRAIGRGKRLRVQSYSEADVLEAIAHADFVYFGIDYQEPVLDLAALVGLRDFDQRPLRILDFNAFGSVAGPELPHGISLWTADDLERAVARFVDVMCSQDRFERAVEEAEAWIEKRLGSLLLSGSVDASLRSG